MANKKISELPELTTTESGDFLVVVDSENNATKKVEASKIINVDQTDVVRRFNYNRENFNGIVADDFSFTPLQPIATSSSVSYISNNHIQIGNSQTEEAFSNVVFYEVQYTGDLLESEKLNCTVLTDSSISGATVPTFSNQGLTFNIGENETKDALKISAATSLDTDTPSTGVVTITGLEVNHSILEFSGSDNITQGTFGFTGDSKTIPFNATYTVTFINFNDS
tara:strand:+ start:331 stop:1002 length:672 start_codon:yes stop_codon:yes gene_type:complete